VYSLLSVYDFLIYLIAYQYFDAFIPIVRIGYSIYKRSIPAVKVLKNKQYVTKISNIFFSCLHN